MHKTDHLYSLIHSLSPSEKRYFTIFATKDTPISNASLLFKAMVDWKDMLYEENVFLKKHQTEPFAKNFAYEKNYLYDLVLKSMRSFHSGKSVEIQLNEMIIDIQFLYDKGLPEMAHKLINKAIDLAKKHQYYNEILVISKYKQILVSERLINIDLEVYKKEINATVNNVTRRFLLYCNRIDIVQMLAKPDWQKDQHKVKAIVDQLIEQLNIESLSFYERDLILNTLTIYYNKTNDYEKLYHICSENIKNQESKNEKPFYKSRKLLTLFSNLLHAVFMTEKLEEYKGVMEKVKKIPISTEVEKAQLFRIYLGYELMYYLNTKDYKNNDQLANELELGLKKHKSLIPVGTYVQFSFNLSLLYFFDGKYKQTQLYHTKLYELISRDPNFFYINVLCRTVEVMCIFSENDWTIIDHSLRSWKRLVDGENSKDEIFDLIYDLYLLIKKETFSSSKINTLVESINDVNCQPQWVQLKEVVTAWIQSSRKRKSLTAF